MKTPSFPIKVGTLALAVFLTSLSVVSAQDASSETSECSGCETTAAAEPDTVSVAEGDTRAESVDQQEQDATAVSEAGTDISPVDDSGIFMESVEQTEQNQPIDYSVTDLNEGLMVDDDPQVYPSLAEPVFMEVAIDVAPVAGIEMTSRDENTQAYAQVSGDIRDGDNRPATTQGNACTDKARYVAFLCAWQGYKRP